MNDRHQHDVKRKPPVREDNESVQGDRRDWHQFKRGGDKRIPVRVGAADENATGDGVLRRKRVRKTVRGNPYLISPSFRGRGYQVRRKKSSVLQEHLQKRYRIPAIAAVLPYP